VRREERRLLGVSARKRTRFVLRRARDHVASSAAAKSQVSIACVRSTTKSHAGDSSIAFRSAHAEAPSNAPWTAKTSASALSQRTIAAPVIAFEN